MTYKLSQSGLGFIAGGEGDALLVLLHGLGANHTVWQRMLRLVENGWAGQWVAPDLRGHGRSTYAGPFGCGVQAADIALLARKLGAVRITVVGHSYGGVVGVALASGWFGIMPDRVFGLGIKTRWQSDEIAKLHHLAKSPARIFPTRAEAVTRYLKVSGLHDLVSFESEQAQSGVVERDGGFALAFAQPAFGDAVSAWPDLIGAARCPVHLAAGENDPMAPLDVMHQDDPGARTIAKAGHNAQWEQPEAVWRWIAEQLTEPAASGQ